MSFLFHVGDLLLDGKEPVDDAVDKVVSDMQWIQPWACNILFRVKLMFDSIVGLPSSSCCCSPCRYSRNNLPVNLSSALHPPISPKPNPATSIHTAGPFLRSILNDEINIELCIIIAECLGRLPKTVWYIRSITSTNTTSNLSVGYERT